MLLLGDWGQQMDLEEHAEEIASLRNQTYAQRRGERTRDQRIARLEQENAELKLYLASLVRLLVSKGAFSGEEFGRFVRVVDESDGTADGKFTGNTAP